MKRYALFMLLMAAAAVVACQKNSVIEENAVEEQPVTGTYVYTVNASIPETKSDYDDEGNFSWSAGDAISVLFHNGDDNQFFTLTRVSGTGNTATFSGSIDDGFTIGSSNTGKIFALYPASTSHSYTPGSNDNYPSFYTPALNDLSGENYSANIPMYDVRDTEGDFTFKNMTCAYKFTITDLDVDKIRVDVHNNDNYYLSGLSTMSSSNYLRYGSGSKDISYILDVTSKTAVVYVSCRYGNDKHFRPTITIKDYVTGLRIKEVTATNAVNIPDKKVKRLTLSAPGTGTPFVSKFAGVDWNSVTVSGTGTEGISLIKATADASYVYILLGVNSANLLTDTGTNANLMYIYLGNGSTSTQTSWMWGTAPNTFDNDPEGYTTVWLTKNGDPYCTGTGNLDATFDSQVNTINGYYYYEFRFSRTDSHFTALPASGKGHVGLRICYNAYDWNGSFAEYSYAPSGGSLLEINL